MPQVMSATAVTRTVNVVDTTPPTITSASSFTVNENETAIATLAATDLNSEATITWSISGSGLSISTAGVLTFSPAADYETKKSYSATVSASDGSNSATQDITITVVDLNDNAPTITSSASFSVNENESVLGTVTATDPDTGSSGAFKSNPITFSISGSELSINSSSGAISLASGLAADYETKYSYTATVTATDGTNSTTQDITITIVDLNDNAPVFTSSAAFSVDENQTSIGTVTATDVDTGSSGAFVSNPVTYSVSGSELAINASSGALSFVTAADYETKYTYTATVTATDGTNSTTQDITVTVNDLNDNAPVITSASSHSFNENATGVVFTATATDVDTSSNNAFQSNPIRYSITGSTDFLINITDGRVLFKVSPDYETQKGL